jgi:hypothetical protein
VIWIKMDTFILHIFGRKYFKNHNIGPWASYLHTGSKILNFESGQHGQLFSLCYLPFCTVGQTSKLNGKFYQYLVMNLKKNLFSNIITFSDKKQEFTYNVNYLLLLALLGKT